MVLFSLKKAKVYIKQNTDARIAVAKYRGKVYKVQGSMHKVHFIR